jgi:mannose-6-phosphate isomerase-like protein (cupin superfamily)
MSDIDHQRTDLERLRSLLGQEGEQEEWKEIEHLIFSIGERLIGVFIMNNENWRKFVQARKQILRKGKNENECKPVKLERPWGHMDIFAETFKTGCMVRIITVNPEQALSLQFHDLRDETYIGVTRSRLKIDDKEACEFGPGDIAYFQRGTRHRLSGLIEGDSVSRVIEVAFFDPKQYKDLAGYQEDIHRDDDQYGRPMKGESNE